MKTGNDFVEIFVESYLIGSEAQKKIGILGKGRKYGVRIFKMKTIL